MANVKGPGKSILDNGSKGDRLAVGVGIVAIIACCGLPILLGVIASIGIAALNIVVGSVALALVIAVGSFVVMRRRQRGDSCRKC